MNASTSPAAVVQSEWRLYGTERVPIISVRSAAPGPTAVVVANMHGDECTGVGVVHALAQLAPERLECGALHLVPTLNPAGLRGGTRMVPGDELDPNRAFPGGSRGSAARRLAGRVWTELTALGPDLLIDLHTDAQLALPYAILDRVVRGRNKNALADRCRGLAVASGLTVLHEYPEERYLRYGLDRSLPGALVNGPGVAAVTLELGPRRALLPAWVDAATAAAMGVLTQAGLMRAPAPPHPTCRGNGPWRRESGPRVSKSGVFMPIVRPGQQLSGGAAFAEVRSLAGEVLETMRLAESGFVVAFPDRAWVERGATSATLAVRDA